MFISIDKFQRGELSTVKIKILPETKLAEIIDFADYLMNKEETEELVRMQMSSKVYLEWVVPENDIYKDLFKDEVE